MPKIVYVDGSNGVYSLPENILNQANDQRFDYIFTEGVWAGAAKGETVSGIDSMMVRTATYRQQLHQFLDNHINKNPIFFDSPCGDLNWVKEFFDKTNYIGGDISGLLIDDLKAKYPNVDLRKFNIITDKFPNADIWHCRHCLFHLSLADVVLALENFCQSNINTAIITNSFRVDMVTFDIPTGCFRHLDLRNYPFYMPQPKLWLLDSHPLYEAACVASGVWEKSQIKEGIENYYKYMNSK